jgi:NTP pyrophosphatase (non-canonical NTP hydrolase)
MDWNQYQKWVESVWMSSTPEIPQEIANRLLEGDEFVMGYVQNLFKEHRELKDLYVMSTGTAGEAGEVMEKLKKYVRDKTLDKETLKLELGDVLYYLSRIASQFGMTFQEVMEANVEKINSRKQRGTMRGSGDNR